MSVVLDALGTHWLAVALLVAAAALGAFAGVRRRAWAGWLAGGLAAFAVGTLALHGWTFRLAPDGQQFHLATVVLLAALGGLVLETGVLLLTRRWSFWVATAFAVVAVAAVGGIGGRWLTAGIVEVAKSVVWIGFLSPWWLVLLVFVPAVVWVSRRSLSGLGPVRKWVAIVARSLVVACLVLALAEPRVRRPSENVCVIFLLDRSASIPQDLDLTDTGNPIDRRWARTRTLIETAVGRRFTQNKDDQFGVVMFGRRPKLAYPPASVVKVPIDDAAAGGIDDNYTDIAAAMKLALASFPEGTSRRIVVVSDGNENLGRAAEQAELARRNGVQVDAVALAPGYRNESEVLVQAVEAPPTTALGARLPVRVLIRNPHPTREIDGTLELVRTGFTGGADGVADQQAQVEIEDGPQVLDPARQPPRVRLVPGLNVFRFRDRDQSKAETSYTYRATFVPLQSVEAPGGKPTPGLAGDRVENNRATAAVIARGQRRVLFIDQAGTPANSPHKKLLTTLADAKVQVVHRTVGALSADKAVLGVFLSNFDCVVLANVPADLLTTDQMETIRTQVHDQGCGLLMVGGVDSFGPGGYQQTPVEAALPVDCEIKAKKATGKGGLVLIMHASEMADGNYWQKQIAKLAVQRLGPVDMVGVCDYGFLNGNVNWQIPFQEIGDGKQGLYDKIDKMNPGDMPDFDPFLTAAETTLSDPKHNLSVRHAILISDGDPNYSAPGQAAIKAMAENGITCTTIGVATHGVNEDKKMQAIASGTKDAGGKTGTFYKVTNPNQLPAIYIKESRKISQSFLYTKQFSPTLHRGGLSEGLPDPLPDLYGFVRTTKKESPLCDMNIEGPVDAQSGQRFPVLASWRYGLGKAAAYTSDARDDSKAWDRDWASSAIYGKFWVRVIDWAMREAERGRIAVATEYREGKVRVTVDARDDQDKPVMGLSLDGAVTRPGKLAPGEKPPPPIQFKPKGAGRYEAEFPAEEAGAYFFRVEGKQGNAVFDTARSGVTVPYSPEFADLESNPALLHRLADATGGQFVEETDTPTKLAETADFFRKGADTIRALLPFWFWLVFAAGLLLVLDVGVRRISIDGAEVRTGSANLWARLRRRSPTTTDNAGGMLGALGKRKAATADVLAKKTRAARKFDAPATAADPPAPAGADDYAAKTDTGPPLPPPPPTREAKPAPEDDGDDFMTRMRKAKERGRKKPDQ